MLQLSQMRKCLIHFDYYDVYQYYSQTMLFFQKQPLNLSLNINKSSHISVFWPLIYLFCFTQLLLLIFQSLASILSNMSADWLNLESLGVRCTLIGWFKLYLLVSWVFISCLDVTSIFIGCFHVTSIFIGWSPVGQAWSTQCHEVYLAWGPRSHWREKHLKIK